MQNHTTQFTFIRRLLCKLGAIATLAAVCGQASATHVINANITKLRLSEYNAFFVYVDQSPTVPAGTITPACVTPQVFPAGSNALYVIDISTPGGRAMMQQLQLAKATNKKVTIVGRGNFPTSFTAAGSMCNVWGGIETVNYMDADE
jgi:hypothetical protein